MKRRPLFVSIIFLTILVNFSYAADNYLLTDLGTLGYNRSFATAINDKGVVVGGVVGGAAVAAVKWENGHGTVLTRPYTDTLSYMAYSINEKNEIVGSNDLDYIGYATIWYEDGGFESLVGRASATDINNHSQVVGWQDVKVDIVGFIWENDQKQHICVPRER